MSDILVKLCAARDGEKGLNMACCIAATPATAHPNPDASDNFLSLA